MVCKYLNKVVIKKTYIVFPVSLSLHSESFCVMSNCDYINVCVFSPIYLPLLVDFQ